MVDRCEEGKVNYQIYLKEPLRERSLTFPCRPRLEPEVKGEKGRGTKTCWKAGKVTGYHTKEDSEAKTSTHDIALESSLPLRLLVPLEDG